MSLILARPDERDSRRLARKQGDRPSLDIALINNMPDSAFRSTERQFFTLVQAAAGRMSVRLHLFTLPSVTRGEETAAHIAVHYERFESLFSRAFDAAIVTGNEPRAAKLSDEPYWRDMQRVIDWADDRTRSSLWSCLAAHVAVLQLHGIKRRLREKKLSGLFDCRADTSDPLMEGSPERIVVPHSRWNGLDRSDLIANGYQIISEGSDTGVDVFTLQRRSAFIFLQGHPEYETDTLLREYRRDVGRYLRGEMSTYPNEPAAYFSPEASAVLRAYRRRAETHRDAALFDVFPSVASPFAIDNRWQKSAVRLYRNWFDGLISQKIGKRTLLA